MKTIHRIFVGILYAIITTNCFGGNSQFDCATPGVKCQFCAENNYIASYPLNGMTVELTPYVFFTAWAESQMLKNNATTAFWCVDFERPEETYDNLRKVFGKIDGSDTCKLSCYKMNKNSETGKWSVGAKANSAESPKCDAPQNDINTTMDALDPDLITCKPCPNEGETGDTNVPGWSGWKQKTGNKERHYYTIANCKGYQRDEKGTYEWVKQSADNTVTPSKCYYTE